MLKLMFAWLVDPPHFQDRRIQACVVVVFSMAIITYCLLFAKDSPVVERIVDWSFATLLATVTVYHAARGVDELSQKRSVRFTMPVTDSPQEGSH